MLATTHERQGNRITELATGKVQIFVTRDKRPSISAAKKESRRIQSGGLGRGLVKVIPRKDGRK